ncbi:hypothetical protein V5799_007903, partial [Amblyomma americanum]
MRSRTIVQGIALFCLITAVSSSVLPEAGERTAIDVAEDAANDVSKALLRIRGNYALHTLTSGDQVMSLRIFLGNSSDSGISVDYESVQVDNVQNHFEIHIGKYLGPH